jgi:hypothetical protein
MKNTIIWNVTECSLVQVLLMFRRTALPPSSKSKNIPRSKQHEDHILLHRNVLLSARRELWYHVILGNHRSELWCVNTMHVGGHERPNSLLFRCIVSVLWVYTVRADLKTLISVYTRSRHWFWARWITFAKTYLICSRSILVLYFHLCRKIPSGSLLSGCRTKAVYTCILSHASYVPHPSHLSWFISLN